MVTNQYHSKSYKLYDIDCTILKSDLTRHDGFLFSLMTSAPSNRGKFVMLSLLVGGLGCFLYMRNKKERFSFA